VNKTITVKFNKDHDYEVYCARVAAGLPVRATQIIEHRMVGKIVYHNGKRFFVESACKNWSRGYYVTLMLNNFSDSHATMCLETIGPCYDETIMERISENISDAAFTDEVLGEKEQKKIERVYKIGHLLNPNTVRKHRTFEEELRIVEKAGLVSA
jgi:hypothetical protein